MHNKHDFKQKIDSNACYLTVLDVAEKAGKCRCTVFRDITKGRLPAIWHLSHKKKRGTRAYLVHPDDANDYIKKVRGKKRVNWDV